MAAHSWRQPGLVLFMFITDLAPSTQAMSNRRFGGDDERPLHITAQPLRRDATICPTSYSLCPSSLSGGCCPSGLSCGVSSCYPTTAAGPVACPGTPGYIACGIEEDGGCCPSGYSCAVNGCIPPAGSSYSQDCSTGSYLCPSSLGYGCCRNDLACGIGFCYQTSFPTVPVTITYTTTISNSITQTITTVIQTAFTQSAAQVQASAAAASLTVTKFTAAATSATSAATAVVKVDASSDSSNGLTTAELGGIIGAAIAVVLVVCVATYLIIRRLNAVARIAKSNPSKKYGPSGSNTKSSSRPRPGGPTASGGYSGLQHIEAMSIDPLMMSDSDTNAAHSTVGLPRPSAVYSAGGEMEPGGSPPIPAPYGSPQAYIGGYQQVPLTDPYSDNSSHHRSQSSESAGRSPGRARSPGSGNITGYFDIDPALRDQNLRHGHVPSRPDVQTHGRQWSDSSRPSVQTHGRQWSDASDVSQLSQGSEIIELEAGLDGNRRSSQQAMEGIGFARLSGRRVSSDSRVGSSTTGGGVVRRDVGAAPGMAQRLEDVQETHLDARDKSVGAGPSSTSTTTTATPKEVPATATATGTTTPRTPKTSYQSQFHEMGISSMGPSGAELERLEQQKVMGNFGDVRKES